MSLSGSAHTYPRRGARNILNTRWAAATQAWEANVAERRAAAREHAAEVGGTPYTRQEMEDQEEAAFDAEADDDAVRALQDGLMQG